MSFRREGEGSIHAADVDKSERLKRVLRVLEDGNWHGTREIRDAADVCAVNSIISELRANSIEVDSRCVGRGRFEYRLRRAGQQQLPLAIAA